MEITNLVRLCQTTFFAKSIVYSLVKDIQEDISLLTTIDKGVNLDDKHSYQLASGYNLEPSSCKRLFLWVSTGLRRWPWWRPKLLLDLLAVSFDCCVPTWCDVLGPFMCILIVGIQPWGKLSPAVLDIWLFDLPARRGCHGLEHNFCSFKIKLKVLVNLIYF